MTKFYLSFICILFLLATSCDTDEKPKPSTITSITPSLGQVGTSVTITGMDFRPTIDGNVVTFNGTVATVISATNTELIVNAPSGATKGPIVVTTNGQETKGPDFTFYSVYAYGSLGNFATYWKDGIPTSVTSGSTSARIRSLAVSGNDVYAVGQEFDGTYYNPKAKMWKNGIASALTDGTGYSEAYKVVLSNQDVHIIGYQTNSQDITVAKYWKNGMATSLTDGTLHSGASDIAISGSDVYVIGNVAKEFKTAMRLWKNGVPVFVVGDERNTRVNAIALSGQDVYIVGQELDDKYTQTVKYWKNGTATSLTDGILTAYGNSIFISNQDIYVVGNKYICNACSIGTTNVWREASYWKNGTQVILKNDPKNSEAIDVKVLGEDVFIVESIEDTYPNNYNRIGSIVLKNGIPLAPFLGSDRTMIIFGVTLSTY